MTMLQNLVRDRSGATAIEYALLAALMSVAAMVAMAALGNSLSNTFNFVNAQLPGSSSSGGNNHHNND